MELINLDYCPRDEVSGGIVELINLDYCPRDGGQWRNRRGDEQT